MKPQRQPSVWTCLATSFAIMMDVDVQDLFADLGHDGSEIMNALTEPHCRRAHHVQELIDCCDRRGFAVTTYEAIPVSRASPIFEFPIWDNLKCAERWLDIIARSVGVMTGFNPGGRPHAWAWSGTEAIDPAHGRAVTVDKYQPRYLYSLRAVQ